MLASGQCKQVVVPVAVIAEDNPCHFRERERLYPCFDRIVAPQRISRDQNGIGKRGQIVDRMLLKVGPAVFVADHPGIHVANCVCPSPGGNATMGKVVVLLDRSVELPNGLRKPAGRETREVFVHQRRGVSRRARSSDRLCLSNCGWVCLCLRQWRQDFLRDGRAGDCRGLFQERSSIHASSTKARKYSRELARHQVRFSDG